MQVVFWLFFCFTGVGLSIPMSGDSFCKQTQGQLGETPITPFQSPCLGTLFASKSREEASAFQTAAFNPHVWGLFLQVEETIRVLGELFETFNPHVWGLFLQVISPMSVAHVSAFSFNPHVWGLFLQGEMSLES